MEDLESKKKLRTPVRTSFSKTVNKITETLESKCEDTDTLATLIVQLEQRFKSLNDIDSQIIGILQKDKNCTQDTFDSEYESISLYEDRYLELKTKLERLLTKLEKTKVINDETKIDINSPSRKFRLPDLELKQFNGDIKEWLSFWSQFKKIHDDPDLPCEDKFQYLVQSTLKGSRAREIVESFPPTAKNYNEAIECLTSRFGRNDILIEVYVRELLGLVITNVMDQVQKYPLVKLYDRIETQLRALKILGVTSDAYASMLYPLVESCLPSDVLKVWERTQTSISQVEGEGKSNKLNQLMIFLRNEIEGDEKIALARSGFGFDKQINRMLPPRFINKNSSRNNNKPSAADLFNSSENKNEMRDNVCLFCSKSHLSRDCKYVMSMSYDKRKSILMEKGACFKCLKLKHTSRFCRSKIKCSVCGGSHLYIMCQAKNDSPLGNKINEKNPEDKLVKENMLANKTCMRQVYLQTLVVQIRGKGKSKFIRALIDSGSQRSYISKYAASSMRYDVINEEEILHSLFGGVETSERHKKYLVHLSNTNNSYHCNFEVLDQERICSDISRIELSPYISELKTRKVFLTDVNNAYDNNLLYEHSPLEINLLIGADVAGKLFTGNIENLCCGLVCMETRLGWTIIGKTKHTEETNSTNTVLSLHVNDAKISDLWNLDTLGICDPNERKSREELEQAAKEHFFQTVTRNDEGRYVVSLPWVRDHPPLSDCRGVAEKRLSNCVKSLEKLERLTDYENVFKDWLEQGVIEEVHTFEKIEKEYFLPHRPVFKENSTTKVRPVFDGSARTKNSPSINDCLEKGPNLVELIPSVLNRFRIGKYGVIADIEKAFLQIELREQDRQFLRFLWWNNGNKEKLQVFQHNRVVFGISSSPFLLGATLEFHLNNAPEKYQQTAKKLLKSFYVDNAVHSLNSEQELNKFIFESQELLRSAKFHLRGWEHTPISGKNSEISEKRNVPVLGLTWVLNNDTLSIDLKNMNEEDQVVTKRSILSTVHKIFDPIGFTCPVTLVPKMLLQECWKLKCTWDSDLTSSMAKKFITWKKQLQVLGEITIPRCLIKNGKNRSLTLHVFCDASEKAYAACVFLRAASDESIDCQLIQARSRVAPLKSLSIARLELLACNIGARLCQTVKESLGMEDIPTWYWSDSSNVLYWIKKNENWATFVFNRVKEIRLLSNPDDWRHIPGHLNPADLPSRGCNSEALARSNWWQGPAWLRSSPDNWPESKIFPDVEIVNEERRKTIVSVTNTENEIRIYDYFSSYPKLLMVVSWIYRFFENCKVKRSFRKFGNITVEERNRAEISLIRIAQQEIFTSPKDKRLSKLQIIVDQNGLYRVKTRLSLKEDLENFKFPIVLPSDHPMVEKIIRWKHCSLGHAGVQIMMMNLREQFWILKYRKTVRRIIRNCVTCKRFDSRPINTPTAPLPIDRLRAASVFEITGIDFTGPLFLKGGQKCWIVIFTCAVFRPIHLELATSLSTESFLQSFRRFIARRGRPSIVYSDNGTNFVGSNNQIKRINWDKVSKYSTVNKIEWKFIPPSAPWWGGWWERLIGIVKRILRKVLGQTSLDFEELNTVMCDCESIVNSRPLTYVSNDIDDLEPLVPSMFLQEVRETGIPDLDVLDCKSLNKRLVYRQRLRKDLRKRFRSEYLGQLRESSKRIEKSTSIKIGDIVLISSDNSKRIDWALGKVIELFTSKDGHIRLVKLKTKNGEILRPTLRLFPLEVNEKEESDFMKSAPQQLRCLKGDALDDIPQCDPINIPEQGGLTSRYGRRLKPVERLNL